MPGGMIPAFAQLRSEPLAGSADPLDVARALAGGRRPAFLQGAWLGGGAILATDPVAQISGSGADVLAALNRQPAVDQGDAPPGTIGGGYIGGLGYLALEAAVPGPPPAWFGFYDHLLRHDGTQWAFEMLWTPGRAQSLDRALTRARRLVASAPAGPGRRAVLRDIRWPDRTVHLRAVAAAQDLIARGGIYQANICAELTARLDGEPFELWRQLVRSLRPSHAAYLPTSSGLSVGASPELFLRRHGDAVATSPIKGTRARSLDPAIDAAARAELSASIKDRAENVMIVDLMRNDLGRVSRTGSVEVADLLRITAGAGVWHLVSRVQAHLLDGVSDADLLVATFPPGSVTGAPKIAAMQAIGCLEQQPRRLYTGTVGILSPTQGLELAVVIRTFEVEINETVVRLGIGGGITEGSDPAAEYEECLVKAAPLLRAAAP
jgi:para-aminobenzoate synthetase/4-amino-4-deoxychorismate lyase